jgi:hypothetical protein
LSIRSAARDLGVAARLGLRALRRGHPRGEDPAAWRTALERWLAPLPQGAVAQWQWVDIPARRAPWLATDVIVASGDIVTWFASGRVYLSRALDIWVQPSFQLWGRIGESGTVFRGTRDTHTFAAPTDGRLQLASYFPGEWADPRGSLGHGAADYHKVSGGMTALVVRWTRGFDARAMLRATAGDVPAAVVAERERLRGVAAPPVGWEYLWFLGPGEIYRPGAAADGRPTIQCTTHGDVGILRRAVSAPLEPGLQLDWRWRVTQLPADLREDSLPSHDYLSIAVEFDDGQDLTYYWSAALPPGTVYRCPLPTWHARETHVVVRSGTAGLGAWLDERRDLYDDYQRHIGGPARSVVRVWLIANSLFLRGHGQCEYAAIGVGGPRTGRIVVL